MINGFGICCSHSPAKERSNDHANNASFGFQKNFSKNGLSDHLAVSLEIQNGAGGRIVPRNFTLQSRRSYLDIYLPQGFASGIDYQVHSFEPARRTPAASNLAARTSVSI